MFLGKNRDRVGLVAAILDAAGSSGGSSKTRIMFAANMSFKLLEKYLETAINLGFIQNDGSIYSLTEQGNEFLRSYKRFQDKHYRLQKDLSELEEERAHLEKKTIDQLSNAS